MLVDDVETTHDYITRSLEKVREIKSETTETVSKNGEIDEFLKAWLMQHGQSQKVA